MSLSQPGRRNFVRRFGLIDLLKSTISIYFGNLLTMLFISIIYGIIFLTKVPLLPAIFASAIVLVCSRYALSRPVKLLDIYKNIFLSKYVLHLIGGVVLITLFFYLPFMKITELFARFLFNFIGSAVYTLAPLFEGFVFIVIFFYACIILVEKENFLRAFVRFFKLIFSNFWRTIGYFIASYLVFFWLPALLLRAIGIDLFIQYRILAIVFLFPFLYISTVLLYYDTRVRKENYNEELLAQEMGYEVSTEVLIA
jgi:hypothetical protein